VTLDAAGTSVLSETIFDNPPGAGYGFVNGPDGNLYFLTNDTGGFGADELGRYVHANEPSPSAQFSSVSNKTLGASCTVAVHGQNGDFTVPWLSLSRYGTALPTVFGNLWVPTDAILPTLAITADDRVYLGLQVPNAPAFLGNSLHLQAMVLSTGFTLTLTNPSELVIRG
jgi:hypothetical protein